MAGGKCLRSIAVWVRIPPSVPYARLLQLAERAGSNPVKSGSESQSEYHWCLSAPQVCYISVDAAHSIPEREDG